MRQNEQKKKKGYLRVSSPSCQTHFHRDRPGRGSIVANLKLQQLHLIRQLCTAPARPANLCRRVMPHDLESPPRWDSDCNIKRSLLMDEQYMLQRQRFSIWTLITCIALTIPLQAGDDFAAKSKVEFQTDVAPILRQQCIDCHGPTMQLADLRLDQRKFAIVDGEDRGLIKAGKSADSLLIQRLVDKKLGLIMPPTFPFFPEDKVGLPEAQIQILKQWIDEGAIWPEGVSLGTEEHAIDIKAKSLFSAIRAGERATIEILLGDGSSSLINTTDRHGATPLMHAVLYGNSALVRRLIEQGADVNAADHSGATALMWAAGDLEKFACS